MHAKPKCPRSEDAAAYVAGEASGDFEAHLATCADCARAVHSARSVFSMLRTAPPVEVSRDLVPAILTEVREQRVVLRWPVVKAFAAAAAVVLVLGLSRMWMPPREAPAPSLTKNDDSVARALDWLCNAQEMDGSWSAARWGGDQRFEPALTALPLMALLSSERATAEQSAAIAKAVQSLQQRQAANGSFGGAFFGSCYNQGIATLALLRAYERQPDAALGRTIESACEVIASTQTAGGGWGYLGSSQPHPAITLWNVEALKLATALGIANARPALDRGVQWIQAHATPAVPPSDVDFYNAHFLASVLEQSSDAPSREKLAAIRETLLTTQVRDGSESGSWSPDDQWGRVGGRLYSTALASLALR